MSEWQPVDTYFDGKVSHAFVALYGPDFMCVGLWDSDSSHDWIDGYGEPCNPTHWMPLPTPPASPLPTSDTGEAAATDSEVPADE